jgi:hypothetical protein
MNWRKYAVKKPVWGGSRMPKTRNVVCPLRQADFGVVLRRRSLSFYTHFYIKNGGSILKKLISLILIFTILAGFASACTNTPEAVDKLKIVCTIFPQYDWVREILGDKADAAELTLLIDSGVDLHSYQASADDIAQIATCDMLIYVGGESDAWVEDALKESANPDRIVVNLVDTLGDLAKDKYLSRSTLKTMLSQRQTTVNANRSPSELESGLITQIKNTKYEYTHFVIAVIFLSIFQSRSLNINSTTTQ